MDLLLVDGPNLAVRRFYAAGGKNLIEQIQSAGALDAEAEEFLYGVAEDTVKAIQARMALDAYDDVRVALDTTPAYDVWRYEYFPDYKGAESNPRPPIGSLVQSFLADVLLEEDIKAYWGARFEADDVLATMVKQAQEADVDVHCFVWSSDRDLWQLVAEDVSVLVEGTQKDGDIWVLGPEEVEEELGVPVAAIPLYKALVGDPSDNLPGVEGIGKKTAPKLIRYVPARKGLPYIPDPTLVDKDFGSLLMAHERQIQRDISLSTLSQGVTLRDVHEDLLEGVFF